ncbi:MAG TPA: hypothetical protein VNS09_21060 [Solirubrobacter sp.]|nr:hypothetical protein [Solirubrobacter sp.]
MPTMKCTQAGGAALALLLAFAVSPAAAAPRACHGRSIRVSAGARHVCLKATAPAASPAAEQHAFDRALLATRLGRHGRTVGAWLGSARSGLTALERALAAPARAATAASPRTSRAAAASRAAAWKTTVRDRTPADATGRAVEIVARRGDAKLTLDSSYVAKAEHCPDAAGEDPGTRTRKISLKLAVPLAGGRTLTLTSTQSVTASFVGTADDTAALATVKLGKVKTKASARGELRDRHGKLLARLSPVNATATITVPTALGTTVAWPAVLTDPGTAFVVNGALKALVRGDGATLDPLLRRFVLQMQTDAWSTYDQARGALVDAQHHWWQAGNCLHVALETPAGASAATGGHLPLRATAILTSPPKHPKHPGIGALPLTATASAGTLAPAAATTQASSGGQADPLTFDFTAPARAGTATATVGIVSKQGVASASVPLTVTSADVHLKVIAVSGSLDYAGSYQEHHCAVTAAEHSVATLDDDDPIGGEYRRGVLALNVPVHWTGTLDYGATGSGCELPSSCHAQVDEPGGPLAGGPPEAIEIVAPQLHFYSGCAAVYRDGPWSGDVQTLTTAVALDAILSGRPFTLTWQSDSGAPRAVSRRLTATVVRVDG